MHKLTISIFSLCVLSAIGCQPAATATVNPVESEGGEPVKLVSQVVEASCGECKFDMEGNGCDLAIRIDGKSYFVDGAKMSDFGNAHGDQGMCNTVRKATVTGDVVDGRFVSTNFELEPLDAEATPDKPDTPHSH